MTVWTRFRFVLIDWAQMREPYPLSVVVVGIGHWHAPRYLTSLRVLGEKIIAVWDTDLAIAQQVASELGVSTGRDLGDLLVSTRPDVIIGMGIHSTMPSCLAMMLEAPAALILEKPLGVRAADVAPLVERAEREGRFAAVAFVNRYTPIWSKLATLHASSRLGRPCYAHFRIISGSPARYVRDGASWMLDPAQSGGGCLINLGTHALDAFRQFVGERVSVVAGQLGHLVHKARIEDYALAILRSDSGILGSVESGYCYAAMAGSDQEWRLVTSNAYLVQRADGLSVQTMDDRRTEQLPVISSADAYHLFLADSLKRIRLGKEPVATLRDGLEVLELVEKIYQVAERTSGTRGH